MEKIKIFKGVFYDYLDKLMTFDEETGKINIDFINNFYKNIPYDLQKNDVNMNLEMKDGKFCHEESILYEITNGPITTGGGTIFFMTIKNGYNKYDNLPKKLVMKVFTDEEFDSVPNYLPLNFDTFLTNVKTGMPSYFNVYERSALYGMTTFDIRNFNDIKIESCLKTYHPTGKYDARIFPYVKSSNYVNEIIQYLIIQKIYDDNKLNYENRNNFIKYHNFYIAKYNGIYRGFVIMEQNSGGMDKFIDEINKATDIINQNQKFNSEEKLKIIQKIYAKILCQLEQSIGETLELLKQKNYMFTHTDLKIENVFYETIDGTNKNNFSDIYSFDEENKIGTYTKDKKIYISRMINNKIYYYNFIIADYDKCGITYNKIRFINDYKKFISSLGINPKQMGQLMYDFAKEKRNGDEYYTYKLVNSIATTVLPTEVLAMRYAPYPFFLCWDYQSLLLSFSTWISNMPNNKLMPNFNNLTKKTNNLNDCQKDIATIFDKYLGHKYYDLFRLYNDFFLTEKKYEGDFTKFIKPFRDNMTGYELKIYTIPELENIKTYDKIVDTLFLTVGQKKMITSLPFIPKHTAKSISLGFVDYLFSVDIKKTIELYKKIINGKNFDENFLRDFFEKIEGHNIVEYSGATHETNAVYSTNRYRKQGLSGKYLYEYDYATNTTYFDWSNSYENLYKEVFNFFMEKLKKINN